MAWFYPFGLIVAGVIAYWNSFQGDFVFDDRPSILESPVIRSLGDPGRLLIGNSRPLVELTLALNYAVGRLDPWGYHLVNLLIHLAAGLALYGLGRRTLLTEPLRVRFAAFANPLAFSIALLWLLHPVQTQSVTYIIQRAESLMGFFALLTLYAVSRRWIVLAITACALGMLSKPVMVTIPLLVLAYDRTFFAGSVREAWRARRPLYLGLAATWVLWALVIATMPREDAATVGFKITEFAPWEYAATQPGVIWHYLRLALWPHPLVLDYHWPVAKTLSAILMPAMGLGVLLVLTLRAFARRSPAGFLGLWVVLILAPSSSVFPITDLIFEYRMYLPLAGLVALGVGTGWRLLRRPALTMVLVLALGASYTTLTIRRNRDYRTDLRIWADTVAKQPNNTRARLTYGYALAQRKRYDEAIAQFNEMLRLKPGDPEALNNLGLTMDKLGQWDEAIRYLRRQSYASALRPHEALVCERDDRHRRLLRRPRAH
jgi:hypothetical protein